MQSPRIDGARQMKLAVALQPEVRFVLMAALRVLQERCGFQFVGYVTTQQEHNFYLSEAPPGLFLELVVSENAMRSTDRKDDLAAVAIAASALESRIGTTIGRFLVSNRHYGRGFALAGSGHPRSRMSEESNWASVLSSYVETFEFWEREFDKHGFDCVLNAGGLVAAAARARGLAFRTLIASRLENYHYWAENEFYENSRIHEAFKHAELPGIFSLERYRPYDIELSLREVNKKQNLLQKFLRQITVLTVKKLYWRLRGYSKGKDYYLTEELIYLWREYMDSTLMSGRSVKKLSDISTGKFVFYPLQTEPEASMGQMSPEFFFQHAAIAAIARDLPAGCLLAVKETIHGVGRRPIGFYRQIMDLKNVVMLDMFEYGIEVVAKSVGVVTISGTPGMEAAIMGKPVIAFGEHCIYGFLDHVWDKADVRDLREPLATMVSGGFDREKAQRDGLRFAEALAAASFNMGSYDYRKPEIVQEDSAIAMAESLFASLRTS